MAQRDQGPMAELRIQTECRSGGGETTGPQGDANAGVDGVTLHVSGEVGLDTIDQLAAGLDGCTGAVVVDLAGVTLVRARNRLTSEGGGLLVRDPPDNVRRVFELTGLTELLAD
jgi:anti-anti-sigma regulatory factor